MSELHYEDLSVGDTFDLGSVTVTESEIVEFAERYDPQPFHVDPEAAQGSMFGGLIASGWHTVSLVNRQFVLEYQSDTANLGGRGVDELRWRRPVRPGDTLSATVEVLDLTPHPDDDDRGDVEYGITAENGDGDVVLTLRIRLLIARRGG